MGNKGGILTLLSHTTQNGPTTIPGNFRERPCTADSGSNGSVSMTLDSKEE